ncbi:hypothetical protein H4R35_006974 [Dimargaris xerosporica]|nr:hypothetical protein H4R35_006974 [Dimargaris xerosporica]
MAPTLLWVLAAMATINLARAVLDPVRGMDAAVTSLAVGKPRGAAASFHYGSSLLSLPPELLIGYIIPELAVSDMTSLEAASKASQVLVKDVQRRHGGKPSAAPPIAEKQKMLPLIVCGRNLLQVFYDLRRQLGLPAMAGPSTVVGLHTLLEGAQLEYRGMTRNFIAYLDAVASGSTAGQAAFELDFPDLFQSHRFRKQDLPPFVMPWLEVEFDEKPVAPDSVKHSLANLGLTCGTRYIAEAVKALLEMLFSPDLLANFRAIAGLGPAEQQGAASTDPVQPRNYQAFMRRLWLEVIGGGNVGQLRYYLGNLLANDVVPGIISQVLRSGRHAEALELAEQAGQSENLATIAQAYPTNAPNYFEFIVIYATVRRLAGLDALLPVAHRKGKVDALLLCSCFEEPRPDSPWKALKRILRLQPAVDATPGQTASEARCQPLVAKYMRNSYL